jgi:hypothetical protein
MFVAFLPAFLYSEPGALQDQDRPKLKRQAAPMGSYGVPDSPDDVYVHQVESSRIEVAPGLILPNAGHVWALDRFAGQPQLVQLKYTIVVANNHAVSNTVKANLAPFIYKPKATWEVPGPAALVRLHDATPEIFFVTVYGNEDAADPAASWGDLALVRLQVRDGNRVVSTTAFTQFTSKAKRSEDQVETLIQKVGSVGWCKISPKQPLPPGEYAFVRLPKQATLLGANIFDFAIDPGAPQNAKVILADSAKKD